MPCGPPNHFGLIDDSWIQVFQKAFAEHWQFGRDIVFTFGPWGFLYGGYLPATHLVSLGAWAVLSVIFWWAGMRVAFACFRNHAIAWLWLIAFSAVSGLTIFLNLDARMTAFVLLLLLMHFFVEDRSFTTTQAWLAVSLGLFGLVKFSLLMAGGVTVCVVAADVVWRQRRFPWILAVFGASVPVFWRLAGQHWSSFIPFLVNSWRVAAGYTDAMCVTPATEWRDVGLFLSAAALLGVLAGYAAWQRHRHFALLPLAAMAFLGFSAFKYGYVRHDGHEVAATMQLLLAALACDAMAWSAARDGKWVFRLAILSTVFIVCLNSAVVGRYSKPGFFPSLTRTFGIQNLAAPFGLLRGAARPDEVYEEYLAPIRNEFPFPRIDGSVDIYPWNQAALLANGLSYRPRPVIQSYTAYTPELAEMNAAFLRGADAPDNILFALNPIDGHFPALEDGCSWPELLTRYDVASTNPAYPLLLKRSPNPRRYQKVFIQEAALAFGSPAVLPAAGDGPIWAEIEINKSLTGGVLSVLYKVPPIWLTVALNDGRQGSFRLIPGMARGGFIISPFIGNLNSFSRLTTREGLAALGGLEVKR